MNISHKGKTVKRKKIGEGNFWLLTLGNGLPKMLKAKIIGVALGFQLCQGQHLAKGVPKNLPNTPKSSQRGPKEA